MIDKTKCDLLIYEDENYIYKTYPGEQMIDQIMTIMKEFLSEPYPIYTYRYFLNKWPDCTLICYDKKNNNKFIGSIVGSCEIKKKGKKQGYIAMLAVENEYRKKGIGKNLVKLLLKIFREKYEVNEVAIETEIDNYVALGLYESFGFIRTKMFINYYLNGNSAYKLKLFEKKFEPVENLNDDNNNNENK